MGMFSWIVSLFKEPEECKELQKVEPVRANRYLTREQVLNIENFILQIQEMYDFKYMYEYDRLVIQKYDISRSTARAIRLGLHKYSELLKKKDNE